MPFLRAKFINLLAPTLSVGLLCGGAYFQKGWPHRQDALGYHERARAAVEAIPLTMGEWVGKEREPQRAAIEILKPNAIRNIELVDPRPTTLRRPVRRVSLSVVQCKLFADMLGHSPPACYPAFGDRMVYANRRDWTIPLNTPLPAPALQPEAMAVTTGNISPSASNLQIGGTEYQFEQVIDGRTYRRIVYNFMVAPRRGILPDMKALEKAAEDYEQRYFGAAQFQVVFHSLAGQELEVGERDEIFSTLMRAAAPAIRVLQDDDVPPSPADQGRTAATAGERR